MMAHRSAGRQLELIARSKNPTLVLDRNHRLVRLTDALDWTELVGTAQEIRSAKLKSKAGRPPNLRVLVGAVIFMSLRRVAYRDAEDLIRHYGPARFLCGLTDSPWTPDFTTIQDFTQQMGPDGLSALNTMVVQMAVCQGFGDPTTLVADTTAQEAPMSYPTEVGLLASFFRSAKRLASHAGIAVGQALRDSRDAIARGEKQLRTYRFFAKSKEERLSLTTKAAAIAKQVSRKLRKALGDPAKSRVKGAGKAARKRLGQLTETMAKLLPQIEYWLENGWVAKNKIVNLSMPLLRSIPRGKVGKDVEFGIKWGVQRIGGGFVLGAADASRGNFNDQRHVREAISTHKELFGSVPISFAYDRGGWSEANNAYLDEVGVRRNAIAPKGGAKWNIDGKEKKRLIKQRARIEGDIGSIKTQRYGFNRPAARSETMMVACGHRAMLGYNLNKLLRYQAARDGIELVA